MEAAAQVSQILISYCASKSCMPSKQETIPSELADYVATRNVQQIPRHDERLVSRYDLLAARIGNSAFAFLERAFELMKERGVIHSNPEGEITVLGHAVRIAHGTDEHESDKIIVRSNGP